MEAKFTAVTPTEHGWTYEPFRSLSHTVAIPADVTKPGLAAWLKATAAGLPAHDMEYNGKPADAWAVYIDVPRGSRCKPGWKALTGRTTLIEPVAV